MKVSPFNFRLLLVKVDRDGERERVGSSMGGPVRRLLKYIIQHRRSSRIQSISSRSGPCFLSTPRLSLHKFLQRKKKRKRKEKNFIVIFLNVLFAGRCEYEPPEEGCGDRLEVAGTRYQGFVYFISLNQGLFCFSLCLVINHQIGVEFVRIEIVTYCEQQSQQLDQSSGENSFEFGLVNHKSYLYYIILQQILFDIVDINLWRN